MYLKKHDKLPISVLIVLSCNICHNQVRKHLHRIGLEKMFSIYKTNNLDFC